MRHIKCTEESKVKIFHELLSTINDSRKKEEYYDCLYIFLLNSATYNIYAKHHILYLFEDISVRPYPINTVRIDINCMDTDEEIKSIKKFYSQQLVQNKKGKKIYNKILSSAPLGRCPYCGIGQVSTLDHFLPKSKFPIFSVLPYNLVPSCKDCNTGKGTNFATEEEKQTLHPYYDNYTAEQWLYAEVLETSPVSVKFYVKVNPHWDDIQKGRVKAHFQEYKLAHRFSIEASNELANLREKFLLYPMSKVQIQRELIREYNIHKKRYLNSWQTALYQALSGSDWYCNGGYK